VRLASLYRARFSTPHSWSTELTGPGGSEGQNFLLTDGRCEGQIAASWRGANYPRRRTDGTLTPDFRGVLETDDGATILFAWQGYGRPRTSETSQLVGSMTHITNHTRYTWLNDALCAVAGEVQHQPERGAVDVVLDIYRLIWEPLAD
jgi:Protein of unknown function (DUF3237)